MDQTLESRTTSPLKMKPVYTAVLVSSLTLAAFSGFRSTALSQATGGVQPAWRYKVVEVSPDAAGNAEFKLNQNGEDGWELVSVLPPAKDQWLTYFFKQRR